MRHMVRYTTIVMILWTIASVIGLALYCARGLKLGDRKSARCGDVRAVWLPIEFLNMILEIWTAIFPIMLMKDRQTSTHRKYILCVMFGIRLLILPLLIARLVFLNRITNSTDWTYDIYPAITTMILEANATVCFSCFPFIKVLVDTFRQRMMFGFNHDHSELKQHTGTDSTGDIAFGDMKMSVVDAIMASPDLEGGSDSEKTMASQMFEPGFYSKHAKFAPITTVVAQWLPHHGVAESDLNDNEILIQTDTMVFSEPC
ncbi:MAG: hypothetical protein M1831_003245 [Alyxoria varia]|nr:MAG: hypothetical protein M1831_003245 [Alyxoria varia]